MRGMGESALKFHKYHKGGLKMTSACPPSLPLMMAITFFLGDGASMYVRFLPWLSSPCLTDFEKNMCWIGKGWICGVMWTPMLWYNIVMYYQIWIKIGCLCAVVCIPWSCIPWSKNAITAMNWSFSPDTVLLSCIHVCIVCPSHLVGHDSCRDKSQWLS